MTKYYEGFGNEHADKEWAAMLGISTSLFRYYMDTEGRTVEDVYAWYGCKYTPPYVKKRKPRLGHRMRMTQERMYMLLLLSGFIGPDDDQDCIEVKRADYNGNHLVAFKGEMLGVFNYNTGGLKLSGGGGIPLYKLEWEEALIRKNDLGLWEPHPDTRALMAKNAIDSRAEKNGEIAQAEYDLRMAGHQKEPTPERWDKYEGFGKQYSAAEWARRLGVPHNTLWRHLQAGQTIEEFVAERKVKELKK